MDTLQDLSTKIFSFKYLPFTNMYINDPLHNVFCIRL